MKKYRFTLGIGLSGEIHDEIFEYDDNTPDNDIDKDWRNWSSDLIYGGWYKVTEVE